MPRRSRADRAHPAKQRRSQETLDRLLDAAEHLLGEVGPDGATLRAIADQAGVSVGIVYRRFPDKDTVLRATYMRFFERAVATNEAAFVKADWDTLSANQIARGFILGMVAGMRRHRALLRALSLYARTHEDADFRRRAESMNESTYRWLTTLLVSRASAMDHPDPASAVPFAIRLVASLAQDYILFRPGGQNSSAEQLVAELTRAFVRYLGIREQRDPRNGATTTADAAATTAAEKR
jgi:AcrR family transcriptional regulator